jgi:hypothetical protein
VPQQNRAYGDRGFLLPNNANGWIIAITWWIFAATITIGPPVVVMLFAHGVVLLLLAVLIFFEIRMLFGFAQILRIAVAPTISNTVAQRFNPIAYYTICGICSVLQYSIALIGVGFVKEVMTALDWTIACLSILGLLILGLITIFPADIDKIPEDLGMYPTDWYESRNSLSRGHVVVGLHVHNLSAAQSGAIHVAAFLLGYSHCVASVAVFLIHNPPVKEGITYWYRIFCFVTICISVVMVLAFFVMQALDGAAAGIIPRYFAADSPSRPLINQVQLTLEISALIFLMDAMIVQSFGAGNLIPEFEY